MTRIIWDFIKKKLILPYLDIDLKYYDLGIESRDATNAKAALNAAASLPLSKRRSRDGFSILLTMLTPSVPAREPSD